MLHMAKYLISSCNLIEVRSLLFMCLDVCGTGDYVKMKENYFRALTKSNYMGVNVLHAHG